MVLAGCLVVSGARRSARSLDDYVTIYRAPKSGGIVREHTETPGINQSLHAHLDIFPNTLVTDQSVVSHAKNYSKI